MAGCCAPFLGPVWCSLSIVLIVKGGWALTRWYFNCVSCFLVKKHAAFKWKDAISAFPVSPGSTEALVRCGGKMKYILTAYFLGNIYTKNCRNRTVYIKIIASCEGGTFFETQCIFKYKTQTNTIYSHLRTFVTNAFYEWTAWISLVLRKRAVSEFWPVWHYYCQYTRKSWGTWFVI